MNPPPPPLLPPPPYPNSSSYSFRPPIPSQLSNPNPNFFRPNYPSPPPPPPPPPDLSSTLSALKNLIQLSESTIHSISSTFPTAAAVVACPFDSNHRVPPEHLFSHTLRCTASPSPVSFSTSDFYYQDCPAVVALPLVKRSSSSTEPFFTLPDVLSDYIGENRKVFSSSSDIRFLPSEVLFVKREMEGWRDYPNHYSRTILRVIVCSCSILCEKDFKDVIWSWIIVNSPRYGVVIDVPVKDHLILLFRLCLRAITSEAIGLVDRDISEFYLKCPVLSEVLRWYGAQLSILYGEINGKLFAVHMLKQLIVNAMTKLLMFSQQPIKSSMGNLLNDGDISAAQVAAAVAAIRERSILEEQVKAIRYSRQLNSSRRVAEHEYISKRSEEERSHRSDYRPIIEHDLFSWQRTRNQYTNVMKSREELLAEERDYKRRRMSYRGKKMKRTATQVTRDIIEEYMGEIKAAGGGYSQDASEEAGNVTSDSFPVSNDSADYVMKKEPFNSSEIGSASPNDRKDLLSYEINRSSRINDRFPKDFEQSKRDQRADSNKHDRNYYSENSEKRTHSRTHEQDSARGHRDATEAQRKFSRRSLERNHSSSYERSSHRRDQFDKKSEDKTRHTRNLGRSHRSDSNSHAKFEDRYDPSESYEISDDDL